MYRLLIPSALVVLVAGCAMPNLFGQQADQPVVADTARTVVVREIYHETPVVYVDTVYLAEEPAPVQPVYVENEYNEYNETNVYVHKQVVVPSPPYHSERGWSPREHDRRPGDRRRDDGSGRDRNRPGGSDKPGPVNPQHPVKKMDAPTVNDRQKSPERPTPPDQLVPPKRQAPARDGRAQVTQVRNEAPKLAPTPTVNKPVVPASDEVQVQVGMNQARRK